MFTSAMPRIALAAIVAIMAGLSLFALWQTMTSINEVDRERAATAINALLKNHVQQLEIYTAEQAYSDEVAQELYAGKIESGSIREAWRETSLSEDHDLAFAFDHDGEQLFAVEAGENSNRNFYLQNVAAIAALTRRITESSDCVGGIIWTGGVPRLLTVARVRPVSDEDLADDVLERPAYIALSKPLTPDLLAHIGKSLGIEGISLSLRSDSSAGLASAAVAEQAGAANITLFWKPALPGQEALSRSLPPILFVLMGGIALVWLLSLLIGRLLRAALRDTLSHLPNRRALEMRILRESAKNKSSILALIDLDGFKRINDNYGSDVGDQLIKAIANMLIRIAPKNATVARLGGDEFAVLCPAAVSEEACLLNAMQTFHRTLAEPLVVGEIRLHLSATIGVSGVLPSAQMLRQDLLVQCDRALGVAKVRCRGGLVVYDDQLAEEFTAQSDLAAKIDSALNAGLLDMHFQPLADARTGRISSAEALMRWQSEADIVNGPEQAISAAEAHGLGMKLAIAVVRDACRKAANWADVQIAVNITPAQFLDPQLPNLITSALVDTGFPAGRLELEITENIAVADEAVFSRQFERLRVMGVNLALDDFGSGYASIGFLRRFPFDKLKIDKSLVDDAASNGAGRDVLVACVAVARALSISTVAEGIETEMHQTLASLSGCNLLQGYYIGKAVSAATFAEIIASQADDRPAGEANRARAG